MAVKDSAATRQRLLGAAVQEFGERGLAGARVDRIASAAKANKQLIYAYFGSKEGLFDAVIADRLGVLIDAVPFDAEDLAGYAGALFDHLLAEPMLERLTAWQRLERPVVSDVESDSYQSKVAAIAAAQQVGRVTRAFTPVEVVVLLLGTVQASWHASPALRHLDASGASGHPPRSGGGARSQASSLSRRREVVIAAVSALFTPPATTS